MYVQSRNGLFFLFIGIFEEQPRDMIAFVSKPPVKGPGEDLRAGKLENIRRRTVPLHSFDYFRERLLS